MIRRRKAGSQKEMVNLCKRTPRKWCAGTRHGEDNCRCQHADFLIGSYPRSGKEALIQGINKLEDTISEIPEHKAILDNDLQTIRSHQEDYQA